MCLNYVCNYSKYAIINIHKPQLAQQPTHLPNVPHFLTLKIKHTIYTKMVVSSKTPVKIVNS